MRACAYNKEGSRSGRAAVCCGRAHECVCGRANACSGERMFGRVCVSGRIGCRVLDGTMRRAHTIHFDSLYTQLTPLHPLTCATIPPPPLDGTIHAKFLLT